MYRTIDTATWTDPNFRALSGNAKLLFLYLITNSHAHVGGIYYIPDIIVAKETSLKIETLDTLWDTLSRPRTELAKIGLVLRDRENEVVWVTNMLKYQGSGEKIYRSVATHLKTLHNSPIIKDFLTKYNGVKRFFKDRVSDTPSRPRTKQDESGIQEQEQEQENLRESPIGDSPAAAGPIEPEPTSPKSGKKPPEPSTPAASSAEPDVRPEPEPPAASGTGEPEPGEQASRTAGDPKLAKARKQKSTQADPNHKAAVDGFCDRWKRKYGVKYPFLGGKDGDAVKWLLRQVGGDLPKLIRAFDDYLNSEDEFYANDRHSLGLLKSQWRKFITSPPPVEASLDFMGPQERTVPPEDFYDRHNWSKAVHDKSPGENQ